MAKVKKKFRMALAWIKYAVAIVIFVVSIGFVGENCVVNRLEHRKEINELQRKIAEQQQRFTNDKRDLEKLKNDPAEVRRIARERYFMKKDNEDVFIIEDE